MSESACTAPGAGRCHGCMKWCNWCGDVKHVCDARLAGKRCDEHPVPPTVVELCRREREAQSRSDRARIELRAAEAELSDVHDMRAARRAYDRQIWEADEAYWAPTLQQKGHDNG